MRPVLSISTLSLSLSFSSFLTLSSPSEKIAGTWTLDDGARYGPGGRKNITEGGNYQADF